MRAARQGGCGRRFSLEASHLASVPAWFNETCPLRYDRIPFDELRNGSRPYLFGGTQRPECTNCHIDTLWANFCQFKNSGPVCSDWDINGLAREFVRRCARPRRPAQPPGPRCPASAQLRI